MSGLLTVAVVLALLGCALMAGVFFAFSSFVMSALARRPPAEAVAAMQSINEVVLNRSFLGTFMGTAVISLVVAGLSATEWGTSSAPWYITGALSYVIGTFLVTVRANVPLNDELAAVTATDPGAVRIWDRYLRLWTRFNTMRATAAIASVLVFTVGLMRETGT